MGDSSPSCQLVAPAQTVAGRSINPGWLMEGTKWYGIYWTVDRQPDEAGKGTLWTVDSGVSALQHGNTAHPTLSWAQGHGGAWGHSTLLSILRKTQARAWVLATMAFLTWKCQARLWTQAGAPAESFWSLEGFYLSSAISWWRYSQNMKPTTGCTDYQNAFCLLTPIIAGTVSHSAAFDGANSYFDFAFLPSRLFPVISMTKVFT